MAVQYSPVLSHPLPQRGTPNWSRATNLFFLLVALRASSTMYTWRSPCRAYHREFFRGQRFGGLGAQFKKAYELLCFAQYGYALVYFNILAERHDTSLSTCAWLPSKRGRWNQTKRWLVLLCIWHCSKYIPRTVERLHGKKNNFLRKPCDLWIFLQLETSRDHAPRLRDSAGVSRYNCSSNEYFYSTQGSIYFPDRDYYRAISLHEIPLPSKRAPPCERKLPFSKLYLKSQCCHTRQAQRRWKH